MDPYGPIGPMWAQWARAPGPPGPRAPGPACEAGDFLEKRPLKKTHFCFFELGPWDLSHQNRTEIPCRGMQSVCQMESYVSKNGSFPFRTPIN